MSFQPFDLLAGWLQQNLLLPLMYQVGLMQWEDISFGWVLFAVYGAAQVVVTFAICLPLERWRPVEHWPDQKAVWVDVLYTVIARVGLLPLITFVAFYSLQVQLNGWMTDQGWVPPTLERLVPSLLGHPVLTFFIYAAILDFGDYWRHRLSHIFNWWYALHAVHHAQRQMTFWSDDRNHLLDEVLSFLWFTAIALLIGIPPLQFPLLVLLLKLLESMSHANARVSFGWLGERLLVSPRFHRAHHGVTAAGLKSVNYGAILPWWDMLFRTADFSSDFVETGDPTAEEALATGSYLTQQWVALRRMFRDMLPKAHHTKG
jgi:sterol desaturase/sphingolipid hydroxylase (fatty acid hydroxylase superfamily)